MKVIKRDGTVVDYDRQRIESSINKAVLNTGEKIDVVKLTDMVEQRIFSDKNKSDVDPLPINDISDTTEHVLRDEGYEKTYQEFHTYRTERTAYRESNSNLSKVIGLIGIETDRDNANVGNNFSAKLLRIGSEASKWYITSSLLPKEEAKAHQNGEVYDQDLDSLNLTINCLHIPTKRILDRGFNPGYGLIRKPNSIETAAILSCILLQSSQNDMFGGQSHPNFDNDLSEYVMITRKNETLRCFIDQYVADYGKTDESDTPESSNKMDKSHIIAAISAIIKESPYRWNRSYLSKLKSGLKNNNNFRSSIISVPIDDLDSDTILTAFCEISDTIDSLKKQVQELPNDSTYWKAFAEKFGKKYQNVWEKVEPRVYRAVRQAMQTVVYNLNTMHSRAGAQVPFSTLNVGIPDNEDAALICEVLLEEYYKGLGNGEQPIFPNIIFRVKQGINRDPGDPYYYLFEKACDVSAHRMNPTFMNLDSKYYKPYYDKGVVGAIMGCRTAVCANVNGKEGPEGRGNIAPATINLPRIGICAMLKYPDDKDKRIEYFFNMLNERLEMCVRKLMTRYGILKNLKVKDIPFSIGQGLMQGNEDMSLNPDDSIEPILKQGTWAIGFIGVAETLICLIGQHHGESKEAQKLGLRIVKTIRDYADKQTKERSLNFGCYATPAEGLCGKLVKSDRNRFGIIKGVTDKDYYTNSYHIPVSFKISIMDKLATEAPYQYLCNSGCISYIEFDGEPTGETIRKIVTKTFVEYPEMNYMAENYHKRTCKDCGASVHGSEDICPECGSRRIQGVSRVTGYLSLDERFGEGKAAEKADRIPHTE